MFSHALGYIIKQEHHRTVLLVERVAPVRIFLCNCHFQFDLIVVGTWNIQSTIALVLVLVFLFHKTYLFLKHQSTAMKLQVIKPYILHPQEWKLGVCLLLLLGGAYLHVQMSVPGGTTQDSDWFPFAAVSTADMRTQMTYNYCRDDLSLLCGHPQNHLDIRTHADTKQAYHIFDREYQDVCLYPHYAAGSLITKTCAQAMHAAPAKLQELQLEEGGDFALLTHIFSFGGNFVCFLLLIAFFSQRQRMEKRMEKGRRRLEQELNDPFLRQVLEKKVAALPEELRAGFTSKLESKAAAWDAPGAALQLVRGQVRIFRFIVLFNFFLTTLADVLLWTFHVTSVARYLENAILSILVLTASYALPLADPTSDKSTVGSGMTSSEQELTPLLRSP